MRWIKFSEAFPKDGEDVYVRFFNINGGTTKECGCYSETNKEVVCATFVITEIGFRNAEWLDESEDTHTPDATFRAEVAKGVLAALMSKEWSDMDLACEQAVKAADKLIQKLNK